MFDVIKMMHTLSHKSFEELLTLSIAEGSQSCSQPSKVELITTIIANRAARAMAMANDSAPDRTRTRYRFCENDGTEHYVMLTPEQERFMRWNHDNAINYDCMDIDIIEDINWETP